MQFRGIQVLIGFYELDWFRFLCKLYKFQVSDDAENKIRLKLFSSLQRKKKQGEFNLTTVRISFKENQKLCHVMNYMIVLFAYELNVLHVSVYYLMFFQKQKNEKEEVFHDILFMKRINECCSLCKLCYLFCCQLHVT